MREAGSAAIISVESTNTNTEPGSAMTTTTAEIKTCSACKYWNKQSDAQGECRVRPPQTVTFKVDEETKFETVFPVTKAEDWCGEFQEA